MESGFDEEEYIPYDDGIDNEGDESDIDSYEYPPPTATASTLQDYRILQTSPSLAPSSASPSTSIRSSPPPTSLPLNLLLPPPRDLLALLDLYLNLNGPAWAWRTTKNAGIPWFPKGISSLNASNPCTDNWQGIACSCNLNSSSARTHPYNTHKNGLAAFGSLESVREMDYYYFDTDNPAFLPTTDDAGVGLNRNLTSGSNNQIQNQNNNNQTLVRLRVDRNRCRISKLFLTKMGLQGKLPMSIGQLGRLQALHLDTNTLTSTLPSSLSRLSLLETFTVNNNKLTGTIPSDIFTRYTKLKSFGVAGNKLQGPLPSSISALKNVTLLNFAYNRFTGSIPPSVWTLTTLKKLDFGINKLTGTFPKEITKLRSLDGIFINYNSFTGTLPSELSVLQKIRNIYIQSNKLRGTINSLTTLPPAPLRDIQAHNNLFTGSLPTAISLLTGLRHLSFTNNKLIGTVPSQLSSLLHLKSLFLDGNRFSGTIPPLGNLKRLRYLVLANNQLEGSLPSDISNCLNLTDLSLGKNFLQGRVPPQYGSFSILTTLDLSYNDLVGNLPSVFASASRIKQLFLQNNSLTGNLDSLFSINIVERLQNVDFSGNLFTGEIPHLIFINAKDNLLTFAAVGNCFRGYIPQDICASKKLQTLAMDGLHSSTRCPISRNKLGLSTITKTVSSEEGISGEIPDCIFAMPMLKTLHLAGNNLVGSLPVANLSSSLVNISLSHNLLTGTIPTSFQMHAFDILDLSFNKFKGHLDGGDSFPNVPRPNATNPPQLLLQVNRLSGDPPPNFKIKDNIKVLYGNMFTCTLLTASQVLPKKDPKESTYSCGSNDFNAIAYFWLSLLAFSVIIFAITVSMFRKRKSSQPSAVESSKNTRAVPATATTTTTATHSSAKINRSTSFFQARNIDISHIFPFLAWLEPAFDLSLFGVDVPHDDFDLRDPAKVNEAHSITIEEELATLAPLPMSGAGNSKGGEVSVSTSTSTKANATSNSAAPPLAPSSSSYADIYGRQSVNNTLLHLPCIKELGEVCAAIRTICIFISCSAIFILSPVYLGIALTDFGTYENRYAWAWSISFIAGPLPTGVIFVALISFIFFFAFLCWQHLQKETWMYRDEEAEMEKVILKEQSKLTPSLRASIVHALPTPVRRSFSSFIPFLHTNFAPSPHSKPADIKWNNSFYRKKATKLQNIDILFVNCCTVLGLNISYVYFLNYLSNSGGSNLVVLGIQAIMAILKFGWNEVGPSSMLAYYQQRQVFFQVILALFNFIVCPIIATMMVSPSCFYYKLMGTAPVVEASYSYETCLQWSVSAGGDKEFCATIGSSTESTIFTPSFTYSYQCASSFITDYASIYVLMFCATTFFVPFAQLFSISLHAYVFRYYPTSCIFPYIDSLTPLVLKTLIASPTNPNPNPNSNPNPNPNSVADSSANAVSQPPHNKQSRELTRARLKRLKKELKEPLMLFHRDSFIVKNVSRIAIIITFGAVFPPIAIIGSLAVLVSTVSNQLIIGRFLQQLNWAAKVDANIKVCRLQQFIALNRQCEGTGRIVSRSMWILLPFLGLFYAPFLFDMLGDNFGATRALVAPGLMTFVPLIIFGTIFLLRFARAKWQRTDTDLLHSRAYVSSKVNPDPNTPTPNPLHPSHPTFNPLRAFKV